MCKGYLWINVDIKDFISSEYILSAKVSAQQKILNSFENIEDGLNPIQAMKEEGNLNICFKTLTGFKDSVNEWKIKFLFIINSLQRW